MKSLTVSTLGTVSSIVLTPFVAAAAAAAAAVDYINLATTSIADREPFVIQWIPLVRNNMQHRSKSCYTVAFLHQAFSVAFVSIAITQFAVSVITSVRQKGL